MVTMVADRTAMPKRTAENSVGYWLWEARLEQGYELAAIAEYLKIRINYLHAIEQDSFRDLPSGAFSQCYLRTYAEFLDLDGDVAIRRFMEQSGQRRHASIRDVVATPQPVVDEDKAPVYILLAMALGLVVTLYAGWVAWQGYQHSEKRIRQPVELPASMIPYVASQPPAQ